MKKIFLIACVSFFTGKAMAQTTAAAAAPNADVKKQTAVKTAKANEVTAPVAPDTFSRNAETVTKEKKEEAIAPVAAMADVNAVQLLATPAQQATPTVKPAPVKE